MMTNGIGTKIMEKLLKLLPIRLLNLLGYVRIRGSADGGYIDFIVKKSWWEMVKRETRKGNIVAGYWHKN